MIRQAVSLIAFAVSILGLVLLFIHGFGDGPMRTSMIYTANVMLIGGIMVYIVMMLIAPRKRRVL